MKKEIFIMCTSLLFSACSDSNNENIDSLPTAQVQEKSGSNGIMKEAVEIDIQIISVQDGRIIVSGTTNLPDTTSLLISLENKIIGFGAQDKSIVEDGSFSTSPLGKKTGLPVGNYTVEIMMPLPSIQSKAVQDIIGKQGQYLSGPLIEDSSWGGRIVVKTIEYVVGATQDIEINTSKHNQKIKSITNEVSVLLKLGQTMENIRGSKDLNKIRSCGEQMRENQKRVKSLQDRTENLSLKYIHLKVAATDVYSCVSCSSNAIEACSRAAESLQAQNKI